MRAAGSHYHAGLVPVMVGPDMDRETALRLYSRCAGVVFTGGNDWNPAVYNQAADPGTDRPEDSRDEIELAILSKTLSDSKPTVGICRGMQGLAIAVYKMSAVASKEPILIPGDFPRYPIKTQYLVPKHGQ